MAAPTHEPDEYATWTPKGALAYQSTRDYLITLFGGAKGGSKTVTGCRIYQTDISNYRDGVFVVMRRNYTDLRITTMASFRRFFPPHLVVDQKNDIWECVNGNQILWWAADPVRDPNYEKTRGLEATAIFYDEASQSDEKLYGILPSLLRRDAYHVETGAPIRKYVYMTANPVIGQHYLKRTFIDPRTMRTPGGARADGRHHFVRSLPDDNPYLPQGYIDDAFSTMSEAMVQMYRFGSWDVDESELVIVPSGDLRTITRARVRDRAPIAAGIDIGLGQPDLTVVWCVNGAGEFWRELELTEYDTMRQVDQLLPVCRRVEANGGRVFVDNGAVGKGVADRLAELCGWGIVEGLSFGEAAVPELVDTGAPHYENRRAQLYWWARLDVQGSATGNGDALQIEESDHLTEELAATYYIPQDGKLKLEPKAKIKERLGRSPDDADAFVLCNGARRAMKLNAFTLPTRNGSHNNSDGNRRTRRLSNLTSGY